MTSGVWNSFLNEIFNFEGMMEDLEAATDGAVVVLHGCCHNPTGVDPSFDQWREILRVMKKKNHFVFFDCAYLGFGSGNPDVDAGPVRTICLFSFN